MANVTPARRDRIYPSESTKQTVAGDRPGKFRPRGERGQKISAQRWEREIDCGPDVFEHVLTEMKNENVTLRGGSECGKHLALLSAY